MSLVSAVQQSESAIYISPLFWISFSFRLSQNTEQNSLSYTMGSRYLFHTQYQQYIYVNPDLPIHPILPLPPFAVHTFVFYIAVSVLVLQIRSSILFFWILHICFHIQATSLIGCLLFHVNYTSIDLTFKNNFQVLRSFQPNAHIQQKLVS